MRNSGEETIEMTKADHLQVDESRGNLFFLPQNSKKYFFLCVFGELSLRSLEASHVGYALLDE